MNKFLCLMLVGIAASLTTFSRADIPPLPFFNPDAPKPPPAEPQKKPQPAGAVSVKEDFSSMAAGEVPDALMVVDGAFEIAELSGNKCLQLNAEPLVDAGVLLGRSLKNGGSVKAKIRATSRKRSFPKFGIGIGGTSGYRLLLIPAQKQIEVIRDGENLATAPAAWKSGAWFWMEFSSVPAAGGKSTLEGRIWEDGQPRPEKPLVTLAAEAPPAGKCSVWGAPYAGTPVQFDDIEITSDK